MGVTSTDFYRTLFNPGEYTCFGNAYAINVTEVQDINVGEFFSINPLAKDKDYAWEQKPKKRKPDVGRRADINVTEFRNFLFEMDQVNTELQYEMMEVLKPYLTTMVFSGGKSIHGILCLETPLDVEVHTTSATMAYSYVWTRLALFFTKKLEEAGYVRPRGNSTFFDSACKNASRLSRCANAMRNNGELQKLLYVGTRTDSERLREIIAQAPKIFVSVTEKTFDSPPIDYMDFRSRASNSLKFKLDSAKSWVDIAGMYPELFRLSLWAIDSTGVDKGLLYEILDKTVFPELLDIGYPGYKLRKPVEDAYKVKRMKI